MIDSSSNLLWVTTMSHTYPIILSQQFAGDMDWRDHIKGRQVLIVSNDTVAPLYLDKVMAMLDGYLLATCILPDGERYKVQASIDKIYDVLMQHHFSRDCTLIALGGGVIGDMVGFAAASFMRGVDFIQMPTTLLSQVDSSVGGKTGINHPLGKNMIGAFWQPVVVVADMDALDTLPAREFAAGMAEVIKYGLIMDRDFLLWLSDNAQKIGQKDKAVLAQMVNRCCAYKADIVKRDEKEQGDRALLNFGHTFGHAIEAYMGYGEWLHGEAVAVGMVQASCLSYGLGHLSLDDVRRVIDLLKMFDLPIVPPDCDHQKLMSLMAHDKKVKAGKLRFVVLEQLGDAKVHGNIALELVQAVLNLPYQSLADGDLSSLELLKQSY